MHLYDMLCIQYVMHHAQPLVSSPRSRRQGEINGHRGLVPSNFLEEVPDDVEVYLTDTPSHYPQEEPASRPPANSAAVSEGKRVHHHRRSQR